MSLDLAQKLDELLDDAEQYTDVYVGGDRARALDYYLRRPMGNERAGWSSVISADVYKTVEGLTTQIANLYVSNHEAVHFVPKGPEDRNEAEIRTATVNYVFYTQNDGFLTLLEAIKDGLLMKAGFLTWNWKKRTRRTEERYQGLEPGTVQLLASQGHEVLEQTESAEMPGMLDVRVRVRTDEGYACIETLSPEDVLVSSRAKSCNVQKSPAVIVRRPMSRQSLKDDGFDPEMVDALPSHTGMDDARIDREADRWDGRDADEVLIHTFYVEIDTDGDGQAELRRIVRCDQTILEDEVCDEIPISSWTPTVMPHEFFGRGPADDAIETQEVKTVLWRQALDNLYLANNPMWRVDGDDSRVNLDDVYNPQIGGVMRAPKDALDVVSLPFVAQHSYPMLEFADGENETRTGYSRIAQSFDPDSMNKTARGMTIMATLAQQRVNLYARMFGEMCLKPMFRGVAKLLKQYGDKALSVRLTGRYVETDPRQWENEYDLGLSVGLGMVDRDQQLMHLQSIEMAQMQAVQMGAMGKLVTPQNLYALQKKKAELLGFTDASQFWTDPSQVPPEPPKPDPKLQLEQAKLQMEAQKSQAQLALDREKAQAQMQVEREKHQMSLQADIEKHERELQFKAHMGQLEGERSAQIESQRIQASNKPAATIQVGGQEAVEQAAASVSQLAAAQSDAVLQAMAVLAQAAQQMAQAAQQMAAPRQVIRDKGGRVVGVAPVGS